MLKIVGFVLFKMMYVFENNLALKKNNVMLSRLTLHSFIFKFLYSSGM